MITSTRASTRILGSSTRARIPSASTRASTRMLMYLVSLLLCLDSYADVRMPSASTRILGSYLIGASPMNSRMLMYLLPLLVRLLVCLCLVPRLVYLVPRLPSASTLVCLVPRLVCVLHRFVCLVPRLVPRLVFLVHRPSPSNIASIRMAIMKTCATTRVLTGASTRTSMPLAIMNGLVPQLLC